MLLYITAEDVLGSETPRRRGPRPLHTIPKTLSALYDLGLRHHLRSAALVWWPGSALERFPDWKLDRLAIRLALFGRERLGLDPGARVAIVGRQSWLWPALDFAAMGFGVVPVGIEHDLGDDAVVEILREAAARAAFASDGDSSQRLARLRRAGRLSHLTLVADDLAGEPECLPLTQVLELGAVLDTPERAQSFRAFSRQIGAEAPAFWHADARGLVRLTHERAMAEAEAHLKARSAAEGDIAYLEAPRVTLRRRLALAEFVGDGLSTVVLGREGRAAEDVAALQPHKLLGAGPWLAAACAGLGPRWPAGLDRRRARRRVQTALGSRIRWVETEAGLPDEALRALSAARIAVD